MPQVFLGLGTNKGNRLEFLQKAFQIISQQFVIHAYSSIYETEPWGEYEQQNFLNAVILVETEMLPQHFFLIVQGIEKQTGRTTSARWKEREIDIDILLFEKNIIEETDLQIPHRYLHQRKFVLIPFCEIAEETVHPVFQKTMGELLRECADKGKVSKTEFTF
ncbi:MAG: 2-amino-4-hydroxy-6-hydroxymethyldihydropteridine diphosphokinase [Bacteroidota bacterium]